LVTECYQAQDPAPGSTRSPNCINVPVPVYGYELLMMGGKTA
jgi:hypothetical protein